MNRHFTKEDNQRVNNENVFNFIIREMQMKITGISNLRTHQKD